MAEPITIEKLFDNFAAPDYFYSNVIMLVEYHSLHVIFFEGCYGKESYHYRSS